MSVSVNNREVKNAVLDFNQTLYRILPDQELGVWGPMRHELVISALAERGISNPSAAIIERTYNVLVKQATRLGWKHSYLALGGKEEEYLKIKAKVNIVEHLNYDPQLLELLKLLTEYFPVHIFTGAQRDMAFKSLEVLLGDQGKQLFEQRLLAVDDMHQGFKPDIAAYREMLEHFDLEPKTTLVVDDQLPEVETAATLGMITFLIHNNHHTDNGFYPHTMINSLADLPKHLQTD